MSMRSVAGATLVFASLVSPLCDVRAQTVAEHIALGDKEYTTLHVDAALRHFHAAIHADSSNYDALWRASRAESDLGEAMKDADAGAPFFARAEDLARHAVRVRPGDAEGHFHLARALGSRALTLGTRDRIKYGTAVHDEAWAALKLDPKHPGANHVLGVWNAEIMRLNRVERFFAKNVLGGGVFGEANWGNAVTFMKKAVDEQPDRITHRLDYGKVLFDRNQDGDRDLARQQFERVLKLPVTDPNDAMYKVEAQDRLKKMS